MEIIERFREEIVKSLGGNLEALILVGSFSRGEGIERLSDIEFWAVVKDLSDVVKPKLDKNVSLGFTTRSHLKKLKPYIYTVEVKKFGKVLYGDRDILNLIPDYSFEDINAIDGFILLNNRIAEQLILLNRLESGELINQYEFDKGYIQLVNSLLVLNKKYRGLYPEKIVEFCKIYKDNNTDFLNKVEEAFASINHQRNEIASPSARNDTEEAGEKCCGIRNDGGEKIASPRNDINREDEKLRKWEELREYFRKVWVEESKIFGGLRYWISAFSLGRPLQFFIYQKASSLYFSNNYQDKKQREAVIRKWEDFVK